MVRRISRSLGEMFRIINPTLCNVHKLIKHAIKVQKQPPRGVSKRCFLQLYVNRTLAWVFSHKFAVYFESISF